MTILCADTTSHIAQINAARDAEESALNEARLARWRARYFRDPVHVPSERHQVVWVSAEHVASIQKIRSV